MTLKPRELTTVNEGYPASDGDGVKLTRMIGTPDLNMLDPFLLFDVIESDQLQDYIGGFPSHPHRGFETVTYILNGRMRHKDSAGNEGVIESGGIQWMTAGKGIIHSEMPEQEDGLLQGFQVWLNLPASEKMSQPAYQEFSVGEIALEHENGNSIRVISGITNKGTKGPVINNHVNPLYMDVSLSADSIFNQNVNSNDNVIIYMIEGEVLIGNLKRKLKSRQLGILDNGNQVDVLALKESHFLFLSAKPLNEPVARGGPFVMNTKSEILQAFEDFKNNQF